MRYRISEFNIDQMPILRKLDEPAFFRAVSDEDELDIGSLKKESSGLQHLVKALC
jgi:hypothetical protein